MSETILLPETLLARFQASREVRSESPVVRPSVFLPRPDSTLGGRLALSTFRLNNLSARAVRDLGERRVHDHLGPERRLKSPVAPPVRDEYQGLAVSPDDIPPRHVNVLGWPGDEVDRLGIANELCAAAEQDLSRIRRYGPPA